MKEAAILLGSLALAWGIWQWARRRRERAKLTKLPIREFERGAIERLCRLLDRPVPENLATLNQADGDSLYDSLVSELLASNAGVTREYEKHEERRAEERRMEGYELLARLKLDPRNDRG